MPIQILRDLRSRCGSIRDQGSRPTCLAFAASDTHAILRSPWAPLSCEFVFYHAQRRSGRSPAQGATLRSMLDALQHDGQPIESGWPYLPSLPADPKTWIPPTSVGDLYRRQSRTSPDLIDEIIRLLNEGRPILIGMTLSDAYYCPAADGLIDAPSEHPDAARRHAVIAVGHGIDEGKRRVLIRNSWGATWGIGGYGWLAESYLLPRLIAVAVLTEEVHVPTSTLAA